MNSAVKFIISLSVDTLAYHSWETWIHLAHVWWHTLQSEFKWCMFYTTKRIKYNQCFWPINTQHSYVPYAFILILIMERSPLDLDLQF